MGHLLCAAGCVAHPQPRGATLCARAQWRRDAAARWVHAQGAGAAHPGAHARSRTWRALQVCRFLLREAVWLPPTYKGGVRGAQRRQQRVCCAGLTSSIAVLDGPSATCVVAHTTFTAAIDPSSGSGLEGAPQ